MNRKALAVVALVSVAGGSLMACSGHDFGAGGDAGSDAEVQVDAAFPDVGSIVSDAGDGGCSNLQCQVDLACDGAQTTLTGTVYDPAGVMPLNGIYVYIPNGPLDPITPGIATADGGLPTTCTACEAPSSGSPIIGALTDASGKFTLTRGTGPYAGVPTGTNIPIVLQAGKWRTQLTITQPVTSCATLDLDTVFNSGMGTPQQQHQMRLPSKASEGDMPRIAFTSGYDPAECFLLHVGIDPSEFVAPASTTGHVHFYTAKNALDPDGAGPQVTGGNTPAETYEWWTNPSNLAQYDIVFNACEGAANGRIPPTTPDGGINAYSSMDDYLKVGGRLFATHYYMNWFTNNVTPDLQSVAQWRTWGAGGGAGIYEADNIDQTFPKGQAYAQWLENIGATTTLGDVTLNDTRDDVLSLEPTSCSTATATCYSTQWIYHPGDNHPRYVSFNTPVNVQANAASQCGRAVFSDVHLSGAVTQDYTFPAECATADPTYATNEKALEFLFFDLASCIQDDSQPQQPPN